MNKFHLYVIQILIILNKNNLTITSCIPLGQWLKDFSSLIDDYSDMFTIFLCMALLEQNRSSIMQVSTLNIDHDDYIGFYFTRLVRQNDAKQALQLARNYHRQYLVFQMRVKQLLLSQIINFLFFISLVFHIYIYV